MDGQTNILIPGEIARPVLIDEMISRNEDCEVARKRARHYMYRLFSGNATCGCSKCGRKLKFKNEKIQCPDCGTVCDKIELIEDYLDRSVKTIIEVNKREFILEVDE